MQVSNWAIRVSKDPTWNLNLKNYERIGVCTEIGRLHVALEKVERAALDNDFRVEEAFVAQGIGSEPVLVRLEVFLHDRVPGSCAETSVCQVPAESRRPVSYCMVAQTVSRSVLDQLLLAVVHHGEDLLVADNVIVLEQVLPEVVHPLVLPVVLVVLDWRRPHEKVEGQQSQALLLFLFLREKTRTEKRNLQIARLFHSELITSESFKE